MTALATTTASLVLMDDVFARGRRRQHEVPADRSIAQAIVDHWPAEWPDKAFPLKVIRNGTEVEDLLEDLEPGDFIAAYPRVDAEAVGAAVIDFAFGEAAAAAAVEGITATVVGAVVISAVSYGISALLAPSAPSLDTNQNQGSNTYRWDGVTTDYAASGAPHPVVLGERVTGGSTVSYSVQTINGRSRLRMVLEISHGPTGGMSGVQTELDGATGEQIPEGVLRINNVDVRKWGTLVRVWTRNGTTYQTAIPGMNDETSTYLQNRRLKQGATETYRASQSVHELRLNLLFFKGLVGITTPGDLAYQRVRFRYRVREWVGGTAPDWSTLSWTRFRAVGRSRAPFPWQEAIEFPHRGEWEVQLQRIDPVATDIQHQDASDLESVEEIVYRDFVMPGTALLGLEIRAAEGLDGPRPQVEVSWRGWMPPVWDGASTTQPVFEREFSRNPFWLTLGMLRDTIWGAGEALRAITFDVQDWQDGADRADALVYADLETTLSAAASAGSTSLWVASTKGWAVGDQAYLDKDGAGEQLVTIGEVLQSRLRITTSTTSALALSTTVKKYHPRFRLDMVLDRRQSPWDLAQQMLATCHARISKIGNHLKVIQSVTRTPVMMVSEGNANVSSFKMRERDPREQPTRLDVHFDNEATRFQRDSIAIHAEDVILDDDDSTEFYDREGYLAVERNPIGITRIEQARRYGATELRILRLSQRDFEVEMPLEALAATDGDRIEIGHRVLASGVVSGRVLADASSGASAVTLDRQVVLTSGVTYALRVRAGENSIITRTVSKSAGTWPRGSAISITGTWPDDVAKYAPYSLGVSGEEVVSAEVTRHGLREDLSIRIEAQEYVEAAYADA